MQDCSRAPTRGQADDPTLEAFLPGAQISRSAGRLASTRLVGSHPARMHALRSDSTLARSARFVSYVYAYTGSGGGNKMRPGGGDDLRPGGGDEMPPEGRMDDGEGGSRDEERRLATAWSHDLGEFDHAMTSIEKLHEKGWCPTLASNN